MISASDVRDLGARLIAARQQHLLPRPRREILRALSRTVEGWLDPESPWRRRAQAELPAATGFSPEMIRHGLPHILEPLAGDAVLRLLDRELGDRNGYGPPLILHVLAGNLPALAAIPIALSLAIKSAALVKASQGDRLFPQWFVDSLREVDTGIGAGAAAVWWAGGTSDVEAAAFGAADLVVASGSDATIRDIARRVPGRFIGHGHRISFAAITREALDACDETAAQLAYDATLWDQQGCLSPQLAYVERNDAIGVERFAEQVGAHLHRLAGELPPRALSFDEQVAVRRFRQEAEWRAVRGEEVVLFTAPAGLQWTVAYDASAVFAPTPLNRTLWVKPVDSLSDLPPLLAPAREALECAGVAAPAQRVEALTARLTAAGVRRVCPLGAMQRPDLTWCPGGRPRVAEWVGR